METKYTIRMKVVDNAGNIKITKRVEVETLNEENANISIVASTEEWTNQSILVAINFNSNVAREKKQVSIDNGSTWVDYTNPITVDKNITIKARVVNSRGEVLEEQEKAITNIDKLPPEDFKVTVATTDDSITVSVPNAKDAEPANGSGKSEIKEYEYTIINGRWKDTYTTTDTTFTFDELTKGSTCKVKVKAIDNAGNEKYASKCILEDGTEIDPDEEIIVRDNTAKYTLTFNANGGTVNPTSIEAKAGETLTMPVPSKEFTVRYNVGNDAPVVPDSITITYTFDGWYTQAEGGEVANYSSMPDEDTTVYAHWTCANPSITLPAPEKEGYEFEGWYTDEDLTDENKIPDGPYTPTENVTLHPKWEETIDTKIEQAGGIEITANPSTENWTNQDVIVTVTYPDIE
ncbi:MAG: InlB B-repeat-containing protein, partial [Bacilli bacterium]|nr:InlB B-repeat-containing protein [Bacilli bacterium]